MKGATNWHTLVATASTWITPAGKNQRWEVLSLLDFWFQSWVVIPKSRLSANTSGSWRKSRILEKRKAQNSRCQTHSQAEKEEKKSSHWRTLMSPPSQKRWRRDISPNWTKLNNSQGKPRSVLWMIWIVEQV